MAFGLTTFAESPFAALGGDAVVVVTGQALSSNLGNTAQTGTATLLF